MQSIDNNAASNIVSMVTARDGATTVTTTDNVRLQLTPKGAESLLNHLLTYAARFGSVEWFNGNVTAKFNEEER